MKKILFLRQALLLFCFGLSFPIFSAEITVKNTCCMQSVLSAPPYLTKNLINNVMGTSLSNLASLLVGSMNNPFILLIAAEGISVAYVMHQPERVRSQLLSAENLMQALHTKSSDLALAGLSGAAYSATETVYTSLEKNTPLKLTYQSCVAPLMFAGKQLESYLVINSTIFSKEQLPYAQELFNNIFNAIMITSFFSTTSELTKKITKEQVKQFLSGLHSSYNTSTSHLAYTGSKQKPQNKKPLKSLVMQKIGSALSKDCAIALISVGSALAGSYMLQTDTTGSLTEENQLLALTGKNSHKHFRAYYRLFLGLPGVLFHRSRC